MNAKMKELLYSIKSEKTKDVYLYYVRYFVEFAKMELQDLELPIEKIQKIIIDYVIHMRNSNLSYSSIRGRVSPLYTFLELNDISVNKRKIERFFGEKSRIAKNLVSICSSCNNNYPTESIYCNKCGQRV